MHILCSQTPCDKHHISQQPCIVYYIFICEPFFGEIQTYKPCVHEANI